MEEIEEIKKQISELQSKVDKLENEKKKENKENKRWRAKVGEYVRTRVGEIYKVTKIDENYGLVYFDKTCWGWSREELDNLVKKHSKNIIDLIKVGDFVNGYKVIGKNTDEVFVFYTIYDKYTDEQHKLRIQSDYIESILTHEQYEQNCYRLEEEE